MKNVFLWIIVTLLLGANSLQSAEDEVIWETEKIGSLNDLLVAPEGDIFYNVKGQSIQIRRIIDGVLLDSITPNDFKNQIYHISVTDDGRYMAISGENPFVIIYDLKDRKEVKRLTADVYERDEFGKKIVYKPDLWYPTSI